MALSANTQADRRDDDTLERVIVTGAKIYRHALVVQTAAGKFKPAANETTTTFAGIAVDECSTGDGTVTCKVYSRGVFQLPLKTAVSVGMVGASIMYAFDDSIVTNLATLGPEIGRLVEFTSTNLGWIELRVGKLSKAS
jgi:hypothetical protein